VWEDGASISSLKTQATQVTAGGKLKLNLAGNGGAVAVISPAMASAQK
jgi:hypothetical protein